ncbi:MAG: penicillin-binding protein activator [Bdellovibrionota bacterium]|nr:MAG: penicillin-binding protein activator [Bdellovibrionota bacterium]
MHLLPPVRRHALARFTFACVLSAILGALCSRPGSAEPLRIGVVAPLSGDASFWGTNGQAGATLAAEDAEKRFGLPVKVRFEDERCDPKAAVAAFQHLTEIEQVRYIVGATCSSSTAAIAPLAERKRVLLITPGSEADSISRMGDFVFRLWTPAGVQATLMARYAYQELGLRRIAVLGLQNDFSAAIMPRFKESFERLGGAIVLEDEYAAGALDFRSALAKARSKHADGVYGITYMTDGVALLKQFKEQKLSMLFLGTSALNSQDFFAAVGALADGIVFADLPESTEEQYKQRFEERFKRAWPGITSTASTSYDAVSLIAEAVSKVGDDTGRVKEFLYGLRDHPGASGSITFDRNGDLQRSHVVYRRASGQNVVVYPAVQ